MNDRAMKALLEAFDRSDWQEMTVTIGTDSLHVSRQVPANGAPGAPVPASAPAPEAAPAAPAPAPAPAPAAAAEPRTEAPAPAPPADVPGGITVESPSVGLFWRAPAPGAPPFVEVGGRVEAGETVAIVEVMKLMNHVVAPAAGVVAAVHAANGDTVEYGQALVTIDAEA